MASNAWHLNNSGQKSFANSGGIPGEDINGGNSLSQLQMGYGIKIAISDNGVEIYHPDLVGNAWFGQHRNYSYSNSDYWNSDPTPDGNEETDAHGTAVTGIIASSFNNSIGSRGIAAKAMFGGFLYVGVSYDLLKTLDQTNGPFDVFNYSYGRNSCVFQDLPDAIIAQLDYGVRNLRNGKGAVYVKAAGNEYVSSISDCVEGETGSYLGNASLEEDNSYPFLMVVGANTAYGTSASYSTPGASLWLSAPGGDYGISYPAIVSTDLTGCSKGFATTANGYNDFDQGGPGNENCDYTSTMNGTSAAAPMVSAAAAVLLGVRNDLTWRDVKYIMALSARKIDPDRASAFTHPYSAKTLVGTVYEYGWQNNAAGFHFHNWYGFGALDLDKAIAIANTFPSLGNQFYQSDWRNESNSYNTDIPDNNAVGFVSEINVVDNLVIEAVQIKVTIDHPHSSDLGIILESPNGTKSTMLYYNSGMLQTSLVDEILLSNKFLGESSAGTWKLKVFDAATGNSGKFKNWKINFWGHYPDANEEMRKPLYYAGVTTSSSSPENSAILEKGALDQVTNLAQSNSTNVKSSRELQSQEVIFIFQQALKNIKQKNKDVFADWELNYIAFDQGYYLVFKKENLYRVFNQEGSLVEEFSSFKSLEYLGVFKGKIIRKVDDLRLSYANEFIEFIRPILSYHVGKDEISTLTTPSESGKYDFFSTQNNDFFEEASFQLPDFESIVGIYKESEKVSIITYSKGTFYLTKLKAMNVYDTLSFDIELEEVLLFDMQDNQIQIVLEDKNNRVTLNTFDGELKLTKQVELSGFFERDKYFFINHQLYQVSKDYKEDNKDKKDEPIYSLELISK